MDNRSPVLSVVIPVYNVEKYIERCVRSLMCQTLQDIEYIFVDDCSEDNSLSILSRVIEDYPQRRNNVILYSLPQNVGVAQVRKVGVSLATGDYVIHCDSDDWVDCNMYEQLYNKATEDNLDIVVTDFLEETSQGKTYRKCGGGRDMVSDCLMKYGSLWCRMVKSSIVHDTRIIWPMENYAEDLALSVQYSILANRSGYVAEPYYHYCRRNDSMLGGRSEEYVIRGQKAYYENMRVVKTVLNDFNLVSKYKSEMAHLSLGMKNVLLPFLAHDNNYLKLWRSTFSEMNTRILFCELITIREKLNYLVTFLGLYPLYHKLIGRNA